MRISLITLHCVNNYGSVLQTYATQQVLTNMGHEVEIVDYYRPDLTLLHKLFSCYLYEAHNLKGLVKNLVFLPSNIAMQKMFGGFRTKYFKVSAHKYYSEADFEKYPIDADAYIVGSDQVWNSVLNHGLIRPYYLSYAKKGKKKIAYSSSFGVDKLKEEEKAFNKEMLSSFDYITTRELSGVSIVKDLGLDNVSQVLDPTLLLSKGKWLEIAEECKEKKPYILVYQLHHHEGLDAYISHLANKQGLKVIRICYRYDEFRKFGHCVYLPHVDQLLGYISNAAYVITDSFHVTAFSVNLNTQFESIVPAKQFGGRISSLLTLVNLQNRGVQDFKHCQFDEKIDFAAVNIILQKKREEDISLIHNKLIENEDNPI